MWGYDGLSAIGTSFSLDTTLFPSQYDCTNVPNLYMSIHLQCYIPSVIDSIAKKKTDKRQLLG
jgi:hypothetical protein